MTHFLLALFLMGSLQVSEHEAYFGKYQSIAKKNQIAFVFAKSGVSELIVDGILVKDGVTFDMYGIFEGSLVLRIDYRDSGNRQCVIKALIHNERKSFLLASGFHLSYRMDANNEPKDLRTFTFELKRL